MSLKSLLAAAALTVIALFSAQSVTAAGQGGAPSVSDAAALGQFEAAIAKYVALREALVAEKITGPKVNSTSAELNRASDALAAAIRRARGNAKRGDVFVTTVTPVFKHRLEDVVRRDHLGPVLSNIDDEGPATTTPSIHLRFPVATAMATMPPSLLAALPALPKSLEYRIVGEYLVLRDVEAAMIIDFIPAVVPR
jgi:hypothetical protein